MKTEQLLIAADRIASERENTSKIDPLILALSKELDELRAEFNIANRTIRNLDDDVHVMKHEKKKGWFKY